MSIGSAFSKFLLRISSQSKTTFFSPLSANQTSGDNDPTWQAALAAQEADISKRKAELEQTSEAWHREAQEARAREAALLAKVETLERLLEVARRTVLDREARLQDAHAKLNTWSHRRENNACTTASAEESETVPSGGEPVIVGARTLGGLQIPVDRRRDASAQEEMREFYGAQEWWLHLASIESGLSRENHSRITGECVRDVTFVERRREEARGEVSRLRSALYDQGLEVVTLRQRLLKVEMELRARAREKDESKVKAFQQAVEMDKAGRVHELTENAHIAELEGQVEVLRVQDSVSEALASARGELTAIKLDVIRAKGEAELSAQLLASSLRSKPCFVSLLRGSGGPNLNWLGSNALNIDSNNYQYTKRGLKIGVETCLSWRLNAGRREATVGPGACTS